MSGRCDARRRGFLPVMSRLCSLVEAEAIDTAGKYSTSVAGEEGFEPSNAGIKIRCLNQLGDSPALNLQEIPALLLP